ncbi:MAG TPA: hypothetical protein VFS67_26010 [Polyangiaceae bacterium]|nr:hypothetical protein [Polyangiaceae bacterium]
MPENLIGQPRLFAAALGRLARWVRARDLHFAVPVVGVLLAGVR